jgi:hypothetical protein
VNAKPVEERSHEEVAVGIVAHLSVHPWFDITEKHNPDPAAVQCLAMAYEGKRNGETIWFLTRYEDEGDEYALVCKMGGEAKRVEMEQYQLEWLWEQVAP